MNEVHAEDAGTVKKRPLYAARDRVYPRAVSGIFRRVKWTALVVLLGIYFIAPWLRWDRGPDASGQAILADMIGQRGYFFGLETWPHEIYYLAGLLILAAVGLFLATALLGRIWCGYACPQSVWTDLLMWVERLIEGDRNARIKLDRGPLTLSKALKKSVKHTVWLAISLVTSVTWVMYFTDAPGLLRDLLALRASGVSVFFIGLFALTAYLCCAIAREQVCVYMCPWPRFQAAMFDEDTLNVSYEAWRGEPRGKHKAGTSWEGHGHCVDCSLCIAVCPTGIDIRDGDQLECIGCGLCIDACNQVMKKLKIPGWLITYDTPSNQEARAAGKPPRFRLLRPRTVVYAALFLGVGLLMLGVLLTRPTFDLHVQRDRNPLYVTLSDGSIRNGYTVKVLNMSRRARSFELVVEGLPSAEMNRLGENAPGRSLTLTAAPDRMASYRVFVRAPRRALASESVHTTFRLTDLESGEVNTHDAVFRGPGK